MLIASPQYAGSHILILEIDVFVKRSALQVKRSLSAAILKLRSDSGAIK